MHAQKKRIRGSMYALYHMPERTATKLLYSSKFLGGVDTTTKPSLRWTAFIDHPMTAERFFSMK